MYICYHPGSTAFRDAAFGEGTGAVFLEGLECDGSESSLLECPMDTALGLSQCDHSEDSGIRCYGQHICMMYVSEDGVVALCFST